MKFMSSYWLERRSKGNSIRAYSTVGIDHTNDFTENYGFSNLRIYFHCVYYSNAYFNMMKCVKRVKCVPENLILFWNEMKSRFILKKKLNQ